MNASKLEKYEERNVIVCTVTALREVIFDMYTGMVEFDLNIDAMTRCDLVDGYKPGLPTVLVFTPQWQTIKYMGTDSRYISDQAKHEIKAIYNTLKKYNIEDIIISINEISDILPENRCVLTPERFSSLMLIFMKDLAKKTKCNIYLSSSNNYGGKILPYVYENLPIHHEQQLLFDEVFPVGTKVKIKRNAHDSFGKFLPKDIYDEVLTVDNYVYNDEYNAIGYILGLRNARYPEPIFYSVKRHNVRLHNIDKLKLPPGTRIKADINVYKNSCSKYLVTKPHGDLFIYGKISCNKRYKVVDDIDKVHMKLSKGDYVGWVDINNIE